MYFFLASNEPSLNVTSDNCVKMHVKTSPTHPLRLGRGSNFSQQVSSCLVQTCVSVECTLFTSRFLTKKSFVFSLRLLLNNHLMRMRYTHTHTHTHTQTHLHYRHSSVKPYLHSVWTVHSVCVCVCLLYFMWAITFRTYCVVVIVWYACVSYIPICIISCAQFLC